ncbi:MAG: hypothetical protein HDT37_06600 [Clostridiales bacterium]|nr:hypothetical protein [Clostridiales bacterium]
MMLFYQNIEEWSSKSCQAFHFFPEAKGRIFGAAWKNLLCHHPSLHVTYHKKRVLNGEKPVFCAENLHTRKKALTKIGFVLY